MEFKKVTISLPKALYDESMGLVNKGMFSNFSDLVRSGIREEFKELQPVIQDFDQRRVYNDKKLIKGVKQSVRESKAGKLVVFKNEKEMNKHLRRL
ncbi:MAG: ribbon-helix-helix domain-containing protein [Nanoarchaeota archaeon]|nr:ribbon-helix-helix domain-containing protein [Nanoarchaeota archaeon]